MAETSGHEVKFSCKFCGLKFDVQEGRVHGRFWECTTCASSERMIRRNLGQKPDDLSNFTTEEQNRFYQKLHEEKKANPNSKLNWETVKATLVSALAVRQISRHEDKVKAKFLPLTVYTAQGWDPEVVKACEHEFSEELNCEVYRVPVKQQSLADVHESVSERLLQQEKNATSPKKSKGKKAEEAQEGGGDVELDVPAAPKNDTKQKDKVKSEAQEAKARASALLKNQRRNSKTNLLAAKNVGQLTQGFSTLSKMVARVETARMDPGSSKAVDECQEKLQLWLTKTKEVLAKAETEPVKTGEEALPELPFDKESVKATAQQVSVLVNSLKTFLPEPKPKAAAKAAGTKRKGAELAPEALPEAGTGGGAPSSVGRRRTTKSK